MCALACGGYRIAAGVIPSRSISFCFSLFTSMRLCSVCMCVWAYGDLRSMSGVFLDHTSPSFFETGSPNQAQSLSVWLTSQLALRIPSLSLPRVELQAGCHPTRHLCEFRESELCAQYYCVWQLLPVTLIQGDSTDTPSSKLQTIQNCKVWGQTLPEEQSQLNRYRGPGGTCPGLNS